jgi:hypothetical protein
MAKKKPQGRPRVPESQKKKNYICVGLTADQVRIMRMKARRLNVRTSTLVRLAVERLDVDGMK